MATLQNASAATASRAFAASSPASKCNSASPLLESPPSIVSSVLAIERIEARTSAAAVKSPIASRDSASRTAASPATRPSLAFNEIFTCAAETATASCRRRRRTSSLKSRRRSLSEAVPNTASRRLIAIASVSRPAASHASASVRIPVAPPPDLIADSKSGIASIGRPETSNARPRT